MARRLVASLFALALALIDLACGATPSSFGPYFFAQHLDQAEKGFDSARFRSFRKDGLLAFPVSMDGSETRFSIVPPLPSKLTYRITVPERPRLQLAIGVLSLGGHELPVPVEFVVRVSSRGLERVVLDETIRRRFANRWFELDADLSSWRGQTVDLTFETRLHRTEFTAPAAGSSSSGLSFLPAWASPVLDDADGASSRGDLILVSIDCLRADHVGVYGYPRATTPALDELARDGVVFENAVSVSSWTLPTHMSMLTGVMPTRHGLTPETKRDPSVPYLPRLLKRQGYETLGITSSLFLTPTFGFEEGFDSFRSLPDAPAERLVQSAIDSLAHRARSRFLFLHLFDAHWPYLPPDGRLDRWGERPRDVSDLLKKVIDREPPSGPEEIQHLKDLYDAEISYLDAQLGRFFAALKKLDRYDDALIIVTADHGEGFYEHRLWQHSGDIYDEVLHVPLIVKWPHSTPRGRVSELASQLQIFPTLLEGAGLPSPQDPTSLLRWARGDLPSSPPTALSEITWEANERRGAMMQLAIHRGTRKYVATFEGSRNDEVYLSRLGKEELYDLTSDPGETLNLFQSETGPGSIESFRSIARAFLEEVRTRRARRGGSSITMNEELKEKLRGLGYLNP